MTFPFLGEDISCGKPVHRELFSPPDGERQGTARSARITAAKALCDACIYKTACLEWALSKPTLADNRVIWGGKTGHERQQINRQRSATTAAANVRRVAQTAVRGTAADAPAMAAPSPAELAETDLVPLLSVLGLPDPIVEVEHEPLIEPPLAA
jgi:hypothetical protein